MSGITAKVLDKLDALAEGRGDRLPLPLAAGSRMGRRLAAVVLEPDGLVPAGPDFHPLEKIDFEQIERALLTEDVGTRYKVELTLSREGQDPVLRFESRVLFMMLFSALRDHDVACRFDFTPRRQRSGPGGQPLRRLLRLLAAAAACAAVFLIFGPDDNFWGLSEFAGLDVLLVHGLVAFAPCAIMLFLFSLLYDAPKGQGAIFPLMSPSKDPDPELEFDDQPLGLAMIAGETYDGVRTGGTEEVQGDRAEADQIREIEDLLG
jgi:hypothetical protein